MSFSFPKALRLRTRRDYKRMAWHFSRHEGAYLVIDAKNNHLKDTRLGITVSRRYGDAHLRNRFKRIVREAFRLCRLELRQGIDLNVRPRKGAVNATVIAIQEDLKRFFA